MQSPRNLILGTLLGASCHALAAPVLFPNGDFSAGNANWAEISGGITYNYPASGGNPGGYGVMDAQNGQWAIWVANNNAPMSLASLGLTAGKSYTFSQDMKILAGNNIGGLKIESWGTSGVISDSGDVYPQKIGNGSTWEKYSFTYTIAANATGIKFVPLWGPSSSVGYDNLGVNNTPAVITPVVPNGNFETPNGASWAFFQDGGHTVTYPATGGNPGGHAIINSVGKPGYAVMVWNNNAFKSLASLGLTAGRTYTFQQDMKILSGSNIGGLKVDFSPGSTGDIYPALIGNGSTWETYSFQITIPQGVTQINLVPLWGPDSEVAYDNFRILLPPPAQPTIAIGRTVSWNPTSTTAVYQPQRSTDGSTFTNLGPAFTGNAVNSTFDPAPAPFYRVQQAVPTVVEAVLNGGFEDADPFDETLPELWQVVQSAPPVRITSDSHSGTASVRIAVGENQGSEIQQNIANAGGGINAGETYNFSFWAKQISSGPSYVQFYKVSWLNASGGIVGDGGLQTFSGAIGVWEKKTQPGLVAPAGANTALIQLIGVTGAVPGSFGSVLVDDVSLSYTGSGSSSVITATAVPAAEIKWQSANGKSYQLQSSTDLVNWANFGAAITGDNMVKKVYDSPLASRRFFRLLEQ